ncbi:MAG: HD domain-containing protein [Rhodocyclaceae bacterium]|nr:HD domain-containing protein [Rhodocyclaceae bacterium]
MLSDDLLNSLPDPLVLTDEADRIVYRNKSWENTTLPIAQGSLRVALANAIVLRPAQEGRPEVLDFGGRQFEHRRIPCLSPLSGPDAHAQYHLHVFRDISESWRLGEERRFIESLYRTLSYCNQTLIRATRAKSLAQGICDALVRLGSYHYSDVSVWVSDEAGGYQRLAWAANAAITSSADLIERLQQASTRFVSDNLSTLLERSPAERRHPVSIPAQAFMGDFIVPPAIECFPLIDGGQGIGALVVVSSPGTISRIREFGLLEELASDLAFGLETLQLRAQKERLETERLESIQRELSQLTATVAAISAMIEVRDPYTAGHQRRVQKLAARIGALLGLSPERLKGLTLAAMIHDIGKIKVPAEILAKPSRLLPPEFLLIQMHAEIGASILAPVAFPWPVAEIVHQHHERWDGSGYPRGLRGEQILLEARILAVADVIEAMATHRPYRPAYPLLDALQFVSQKSGELFDPQVVEACLKLFLEEGYSFAEASSPEDEAANR